METELDGLDSSLDAVVELIGNSRRALQIYTPIIEPRLYGDTRIIDALRTQVITNSRIEIQLLLPPSRQWRRECPALTDLIGRLTALELRTLPRNEPRDRAEYSQGFMIADHRILLLHTDPRRLIGRYDTEPGGRVRDLGGFFQELWPKAQSDSELRRLGI